MPKKLPDYITHIDDAAAWQARAARSTEGATCPCCKRFDKVYRRRMNKSAVKDLIELYRVSMRRGVRFYHYTDFMLGAIRHGDFSKFLHLGMIERIDPETSKKKTSGMYRITEHGINFCKGYVAIPEKIVLYHNELIAVEGERQKVTDLFPTFDYSELMSH